MVNQSLAAARPRDPLLAARARAESGPLGTVRETAARTAVVPALPAEPVGVGRLRDLTRLSPAAAVP